MCISVLSSDVNPGHEATLRQVQFTDDVTDCKQVRSLNLTSTNRNSIQMRRHLQRLLGHPSINYYRAAHCKQVHESKTITPVSP